jgi:hypothetical protein
MWDCFTISEVILSWNRSQGLIRTTDDADVDEEEEEFLDPIWGLFIFKSNAALLWK